MQTASPEVEPPVSKVCNEDLNRRVIAQHRPSPGRSRSGSPAPLRPTFEKETSPFLKAKTKLKPVAKTPPARHEVEWKRAGLMLKPRKQAPARQKTGFAAELVIVQCGFKWFKKTAVHTHRCTMIVIYI